MGQEEVFGEKGGVIGLIGDGEKKQNEMGRRL